MTTVVVTTKGFDVVLVVHVLAALAALIVLVVLRSAARAVQRGQPSEAARRSFGGGPELAGRVVHLVPLSGLVLVLASRGAYGLSSGFVLVGFALWCCAAWLLEVVGFPAQRDVAAALAKGGATGDATKSLIFAVDLASLSLVLAAVVMVAANA